ncbi:MAG: hypothetical protein QXZ30_03080, partial [Candidatus Bilamarchaeaceae archaeon]
IFISSMLVAFFIFHSKKNATLSLQTFSAPQMLSTPLKEYKNSHFGFSLFYPQELNVSQSSLSMIKVKKKHTQDEIATLQVITFSSSSFESFVRKQLSMLCSNFDKQSQIVTFCPTIDRQQTFTTKEGITGSIYYLSEVTKNDIYQKEISKVIKGPFFVFDLTSQIASEQAILLMYPPLRKEQDDMNLLLKLVEGLRLEKRRVKDTQIQISPSTNASISSPLHNF